MHHLKKIVVVIVIGAIGFFAYTKFFSSAGNGQNGGGMPPMPVVTYKVQGQDLKFDFSAVGTLEANQSAVLRPEIKGIITAINFQEGQKVTKGETLLEVDRDTYTAELNRAKAAYDLAKITFGRRKELRQKGVAAAQSSDEAEADLRQTKAEYELAEINLKKTRITAPFGGIVGLRKLSVGDYLDTGDEITHLVEIDPMKVEFTVPEKFLSEIQEDLKISAKVDAYPDQQFEGTVYAIDPVIDSDTRNIVIKAYVSNPDMKLRPGMFAFVNIEFGTRHNALMIPEEAIINKGKDKFVYVVKAGKADLQPVETGTRREGVVEVTKGITAGDEVITAGYMKVQPGGAVQPVDANAPTSKDGPPAQP